jgi:hypothetical protein
MVRNLAPEFIKRHPIDLLNAICPGKLGFAYNRIDFRQNQPVGYGFINFRPLSQVDNDSKKAAFERDIHCRTTLMVRNLAPEFTRATSSIC